MLRGNLGNIISVVITLVVGLYLIIPFNFILKDGPRSLAFLPHEDPETAEQVFSGTSPLIFNPEYLNLIPQMNLEEVEAIIRKWPLSHFSQSVEEATSNVLVSGVNHNRWNIPYFRPRVKYIIWLNDYQWPPLTEAVASGDPQRHFPIQIPLRNLFPESGHHLL